MKVKDLNQRDIREFIELLNDITITNIKEDSSEQVLARALLIQTLIQVSNNLEVSKEAIAELQVFIDCVDNDEER